MFVLQPSNNLFDPVTWVHIDHCSAELQLCAWLFFCPCLNILLFIAYYQITVIDERMLSCILFWISTDEMLISGLVCSK